MTLPNTPHSWAITAALAFTIVSPGCAIIMIAKAMCGVLGAVKQVVEKGSK